MGGVLFKYLSVMLLQRTLATLAVLVGLLQLVDLFEATPQVLERGLGLGGIIHYEILRLPGMVQQILPVSVLIGALTCFTGLARNSEMSALRASGVTIYRIVAMLMPTVALIAVAHFLIADQVAPRSEQAFTVWWGSHAPIVKTSKDEPKAAPKKARTVWFRTGPYLVYAEAASADGRRLDGLRIYHRDANGRLDQRIVARSAQLGADGKWLLQGSELLGVAPTRLNPSLRTDRIWHTDLAPADVVSVFSPDDRISSGRALRAISGLAPAVQPWGGPALHDGRWGAHRPRPDQRPAAAPGSVGRPPAVLRPGRRGPGPSGRLKPVADIAIVEVRSAAEMDRFVRLPMRLNAGDPAWSPPLLMERKEALDPKVNPFFAHADVALWLAVRDGRDVGRISAQIDHLAPPDPLGPAGFFGMIAAEDDPAVFAALFATAEAWLAAKGKVRALGPFNLSINEEVGLLVDGFDRPPMVMMGHDPAFTGGRIEALGYAKEKDVFAYLIDTAVDVPAAARRRLDRGPAKGVTLRMLDMKRYDEEVRTLAGIFNDAWAGNWGFAPWTEAEMNHLGKALKLLLNPKLFWFAEVDGEPVGFGVVLPNLNEAIRDLNGRLFPFGIAKLLWRLKVAGVKSGRLPLMGIKRSAYNDVRGAMLPFLIIDNLRREALKLGIRSVEMSWILEDNAPMRRIIEAVGGERYKTYRIYSKAIA
ncbi:MAG: hypothetical protein B7Y99_07880 [Caulobacterales bacterium 32-69-10]|nr:MAG: hypothetical protein B7Y99_07880 [Caulobacterales bacterium 32-69-10]